MNIHKVCHKTIPSKFWQNEESQCTRINSCFYMIRKLLACFYQLEVLCNTSFFSMINWFSSFLILFFLLHINFIYLGYFFKIKEIMNVNRCILLACIIKRKICYDKIGDYGQLCAFLPNYWPWTLWKVLFNMILHIWQTFRLSGTTFVTKVCIKFEYVCNPVFCEHSLLVETTYIQMTKLGRKGPMTCFTKIHISLWLLGQIRWGLHWIVGK